MKVVLYARGEQKQFAAFADGCQATGHTVVWQNPRYWNPKELVRNADAVVIHGIQLYKSEILRLYRERGVPVWIMELPRLRDEPEAHGLYLNSVHWIPEKGYRKPVSHGLLKSHGDAVLVAGQVPNDIAHGMPAKAWDAWARNTVKEAREKYDSKVIYRQHPVYDTPVPDDKFGADDVDESETIYEALAKCKLVICHNSTVGWNAIDAGIPVYHTAEGIHSPGWKNYTGQISKEKRKEALGRVASTQWTLSEMRDGSCQTRIFGTLEGLKVA
jgi:hypothetical protein